MRAVAFSVETCGGMAEDAVDLLDRIATAGAEHLAFWSHNRIVQHLLAVVAVRSRRQCDDGAALASRCHLRASVGGGLDTKEAEYGVVDGFYCLKSVSVAIASIERTEHSTADELGPILPCPHYNNTARHQSHHHFLPTCPSTALYFLPSTPPHTRLRVAS